MPQEALSQAIENLARFIFVVTEEPSRFVRWMYDNYSKRDQYTVKVWRPTLGLKDIDAYVNLWENFSASDLRIQQDAEANTVLEGLLAHKTEWNRNYTIMLGADMMVNGQNPQLTRRLMDMAEQLHQNGDSFKSLIFVGHRLQIPPGMERMFHVCHFELPTAEEHKAAIVNIIESEQLISKYRSNIDVDGCAQALTGLTHYEAEQVILESLAQHKRMTPEMVYVAKRKIIKKNPLLELMDPTIGFDDVGGMEHLKTYLRSWKGAWTQEAKEYGLGRFKGTCLVGLPGNGKSLIAKAMATEYELPLVRFDPARLFAGQVGASETNMHRALDTLEKMAPCICFIDEIEKGLAGMQSSSFSDSGTTARVIGSFLSWMQETEEDVVLVATANDITQLPPELLRRFNDIFFVGLPNRIQRREIWQIHIRAKGRNPADYDLDALVKASNDRSGSEIETAVNSALVTSWKDGKRKLTTADLVEAVENKPPLVITMREQLQGILEWVGKDEATGQGIRARFAHADEPKVDMDVG